MAFLLYFVVILVTAASVMFGLDLMTSPLPSIPNVLIGRHVEVAPPPARHDAKDASTTRAADDRALSPIYPASPRVPTQRNQETSNMSPDSSPPLSEAKALNTAPDANVAQTNARCNLQACAAAYRSFRASDCSYQPYQGPRQLCTRSGSALSAATRPRRLRAGEYAGRPLQTSPLLARPARNSDRFDDITRIVRKMTRGQEGDVAVQDSEGRIIIIHPGRARAYSPFDDDDRD